jgi:hypothetical protein
MAASGRHPGGAPPRVAIYLEDGSTLRLRAPYDGGLLGRDPRFEQKMFMICHLWETHRYWTVRG